MRAVLLCLLASACVPAAPSSGDTACPSAGCTVDTGPGGDPGGDRPPIVRVTWSPRVPTSGDVVVFDGSESEDPDGDPITSWTWVLEERPNGSGTVLANPSGSQAQVLVDLLGPYRVSLTVQAGGLAASEEVELDLGTANQPPVADAGQDLDATLGGTVSLDAVRSEDPEADPLTYAWSWRSRPPGSQVGITDATRRRCSFVPDRAGCWVAVVEVSDGQSTSAPDAVCVRVVDPSDPGPLPQCLHPDCHP